MCGGMPGAWLCSNLLISINGLALALPVACLLSVLSCFSDHVVLACLLTFLAVMVTSGLFVASVESSFVGLGSSCQDLSNAVIESQWNGGRARSFRILEQLTITRF